jgi:hypothetical protein
MRWIQSSERKWDCPHVNKCDLLVERDGELFLWNTDLPDPKDCIDKENAEYKYVFLIDLLQDFTISTGRTYIPCSCKEDRE